MSATLVMPGVAALQSSTALKPINAGAAGVAMWERLSTLRIDTKGPYPYSKRLAKESDFPYAYTLEVITEYLKVLFIKATVYEDAVSPPDVEEAHRLHLIYTKSYWGMCKEVIGKRIEHEPDDGTVPASVMSERYARTVQAYRQVFGEEPPAHIWCEPEWRALPPMQDLLRKGRLLRRRIRSLVMPTPVRMRIPLAGLNAKQEHVFRQLEDFPFDKPGAPYPFSARLADESFEGDRERAFRAIGEYIKFYHLLWMTGHWVTPALDVDEVWHLHMGHTQSYWVEFPKILGRPYDHFPGDGTPEDELKFQAIFERTRDDYRKVFGEPPVEVWGHDNPHLDWRKVLEGTGF